MMLYKNMKARPGLIIEETINKQIKKYKWTHIPVYNGVKREVFVEHQLGWTIYLTNFRLYRPEYGDARGRTQ